MCGITGIFSFNLVGGFHMINTAKATKALSSRGPDAQNTYNDQVAALGHRRLSVLDPSSSANQPMSSSSNRYHLVYNGEIYNFRELREGLERKGISFNTNSDTEVLLHLLMEEGKGCLEKLNGFFSFAFYDKLEKSILLVRDRYGIKPLYYLLDDDKLLFASEPKSILEYGIQKDMDYEALMNYLHLNYIPAPNTIYKNVKKLKPGHFLEIKNNAVEIQQWYKGFEGIREISLSYEDAKKKLRELIEESVKERLVSDVPLGSFLSGGVDSSIIAAVAAQYKPDLHTFSIGFKDQSFFDETEYAKKVAKHIGSRHEVFSLTNEDLLSHITQTLDYLDEPFADSSALAVYILSKETRKHCTVALSGDGADELFGGYNKHYALYRSMHKGVMDYLTYLGTPLWHLLPSSRSSGFGNKVRQLKRYSQGLRLNPGERYWQWAGFSTLEKTFQLLSDKSKELFNRELFIDQKNHLLEDIRGKGSMNDFLRTDLKMVLPDDMLTKVDRMSMAHGLEVRVPFLSHKVVEFVSSLPSEYKIDKQGRKKILKDAFRDLLPEEVFNRPKKGFELPMLQWMRTDLKGRILEEWLSEGRIMDEGIFNPKEIRKLKNQLFSSNPGDIHARIWGLIVFEHFWKRYNPK